VQKIPVPYLEKRGSFPAPIPPQKMAYLWKFVNLHKIWGFVKRPVKMRSKKEEKIREEKIK